MLILPATSPDRSSTNVPEPSVSGTNLAGLPRSAGGGKTTRFDFDAEGAAAATLGKGGAAVLLWSEFWKSPIRVGERNRMETRYQPLLD